MTATEAGCSPQKVSDDAVGVAAGLLRGLQRHKAWSAPDAKEERGGAYMPRMFTFPYQDTFEKR